jgi:hypothetical protein
MVDQREALSVTTDLLTQFIWFALPGFEPTAIGSVSSNPAFTTKLSGTWVKGKGWTSACYPFQEATTSTTSQSVADVSI